MGTDGLRADDLLEPPLHRCGRERPVVAWGRRGSALSEAEEEEVAKVRERLRSVALVASAACAVGAIVAVGCQPAAAAPSAVRKCSAVKVGGHTYNVSATNVACSFADKWVSVLAGKRLKAHAVQVPLSGGPSGYSCRGGTKPQGVAMPDVAGNVQVSGNCAKGLGLGSSPYFNWVVVSKY
jgi:hypothetical protein